MKEKELMESSNGEKGYRKICGIPCNLWFVAGFVMLAFVPLPLDFIALANAGQSLIIPVGTGMTIVWNQLISPVVLKEKLSRQDKIATFFIVVGIVMSTAFGTHASPVYPSSTLISLFGETAFAILLVFLFITTVVASIVIHVEKVRLSIKEELQENVKLLSLGYIPSVYGSLQIMVFKVVGELSKNTFEGIPMEKREIVNGTMITNSYIRKVNEFLSWEIYFFTICVAFLAVFQITYMNKGLSMYNAVKYLPVYNTMLLMTCVVVGSIFFKEYKTFHPVCFPIGCLLQAFGIRLLAWQKVQVEEERILETIDNIVTEDGGSEMTENTDR